MNHPLDGPRGKLRRAQAHLDSLEQEVRAFGKLNPYEVSQQFDTETGEEVFTVHVRHEPDGSWGLIVGDFIHNVRSALDHLVWALVLVTGAKPNRDHQFPIASRGTAYWCSRKDGTPSMRDRMLKGIPESHRTIIDSIQPYRRGDSQNAPLAIIQWLSNVDKHQVLHPTLVSILEPDPADIKLISESKTGMAEISYTSGPLQDGAEVARMKLTSDTPGEADVQIEAHFRVGIGFGEKGLRIDGLPPLLEHAAMIIQAYEPGFEPPA